MAPRPYVQPGLTLASGQANDPIIVRALQSDLRALGYLHGGIDGNFGAGTTRAVRALETDLLRNSGAGSDGAAPVAMTAYNRDAAGNRLVTAVTGVLDQNRAQCLAAVLADARVPKLPAAADPVAENLTAITAVRATPSRIAPTPFIAAIVIQESNGQHFRVPGSGDTDSYVTIGLDHNDANDADRITSRGYGIGQYTLFHHPPRNDEVVAYVSDPERNVQQAFTELRAKFENLVMGPQSRASDREVEHPLLPLRLCKYQPSDPLYMNDCKACATAARKINIDRGTPCYQGATVSYQPDQYYPSAVYFNVPDRADFACDWPYATRRYNGSGNDSFHYQTHILLNLLK